MRVLYDRDHLYIGIRFYDREPRQLISTRKERDAFVDADDRFELIIDTCLDRRNAFFCQMTPAWCRGHDM